jgi:hypothetical protein
MPIPFKKTVKYQKMLLLLVQRGDFDQNRNAEKRFEGNLVRFPVTFE